MSSTSLPAYAVPAPPHRGSGRSRCLLGIACALLSLGSPQATPLSAQAPPATDLWVAPLTEGPDGIEIRAPERLTDRDGYDNQPSFLPGGRTLLYTSIDSTGQADIWRIDLRSLTPERLTRTAPESEYSPTLMPGGQGISVVRVEADSTQRLWHFELDGTPVAPILPEVAPVGYHAWADSETLVLFVLGDPPTLQVADPATGDTRVVAEDIGRTLLPVPGSRHSVSFLQRRGPDEAWITELDPATGALRPLVRGFQENEYYTWTPNGTLLSAKGSRIYAWRGGWGEWKEVTDLSSYGVGAASRLAVSPEGDRLALVAAR